MNKRSLAAIAAAILLYTPIMMANPEALTWQTINQGLESAAKENKLVVLDVYTDWCGWCKRMDRDTYSDSTTVAYLKDHYLACKMNPEKKGSLTFQGKNFTYGEFCQALGIHGYPATAFFNSKGELLTVVSGYMGPKDFLPVLQYFGSGAYLNGTYEEYMKKRTAGTQ